MILLTGATSAVGSALLRRLVAAHRPTRCLVRDPRRLGPDRMRVGLTLGDLADPPSFRNALRGVTTVVHLAHTQRDQPRGSIEEVTGLGTWRLVEAAERAGAERFVLLSDARASAHDPTRFRRAKALGEDALLGSSLHATVLAPSLVLGDGLLARLAALPVVPVPAGARGAFAPVDAEAVAQAAFAALDGDGGRIELRGPRVLSTAAVVREATGRRALPVPVGLLEPALRAGEAVLGQRMPLTWDELELLA